VQLLQIRRRRRTHRTWLPAPQSRRVDGADVRWSTKRSEMMPSSILSLFNVVIVLVIVNAFSIRYYYYRGENCTAPLCRLLKLRPYNFLITRVAASYSLGGACLVSHTITCEILDLEGRLLRGIVGFIYHGHRVSQVHGQSHTSGKKRASDCSSGYTLTYKLHVWHTLCYQVKVG